MSASTNPTSWPNSGLDAVPCCPVCDSGNRRLMYKGLTDILLGVAPGEWNLYQCLSCATAWIDPRPSPATIVMAYRDYITHENQSSTVNSNSGFMRRFVRGLLNDYRACHYNDNRTPTILGGRWVVLLFHSMKTSIDANYRHLTPQTDAVGRLLDYGCANGEFLTIAKSMGWSAEGVDFDPVAVSLARARGLDVALIEAGEMLEGTGLYDVITLSHVLEHVHDPVHLISDLFRLLKPGGVLWLETPNISSFGHRAFGRFWRGLEPPRHLTLFSSNTLKRVLLRAGFDDVEALWHGLSAFVMFPESDALKRGGRRPKTLLGGVSLFLKRLFFEFIDWVSPSSREFITLVARKPGDQ
ncbi:class I SAM-dependent methyltransferase [Congregibacter variabilis]|uniref:Class I SAM-dependent methyltransferase n=1 Tax=Congregibacter variabilis TaxID=3081200 RepID=A0ABZ0I0X4_9GAMM|nr:class I SAM-dependent methyltransferase [Congregibacter sp. IMCC43200]